MNVLVYDGPGASKTSVSGALSSLSALLSPYYSVRLITAKALLDEPWASTTSLLVMPGGRDLPYCAELNGTGTRKIDEYVRRGGKYLGLCAGSYFASKNVEFELGTSLAVQGSRELAFWKGICRGCAFEGFVYDGEEGARMAKLHIDFNLELAVSGNVIETAMDDLKIDTSDASVAKDRLLEIYWNGGGVFVDAEKDESVETLARYQDPVRIEGGSAAVIFVRHGRGSVILSAVHPEINPTAVASSSNHKIRSDEVNSGVTAQAKLRPLADTFIPKAELKSQRRRQRKERSTLLRSFLHKLGLKTNENLARSPELSTLHLLSYSEKVRLPVVEALRHLSRPASNNSNLINAENDTFCVITEPSQRPSIVDDEDDESGVLPPEHQTMYISTHRHPPEFPLFNTQKYFALLHRLHYASQPPSRSYSDPRLGTSLFYAETVTSSQSLLDKNFSLQRELPDGFTILCSHQISGRGRGQNSWISPAGVLSFSTILHHAPKSTDKAGAILFIQYLVSLAVTDSILALRPQLGVRIKWPNDIYLEVPQSASASTSNFEVGGKKYAKISGSLITTSYYQQKYIMVIGVGINVSNPDPTISLNSVLSEQEAISMEELLATIMVTFSSYYQDFIASSSGSTAPFAKFERRYYDCWLHTNQQVKIEATDETGTIQGIDMENGTLRVKTRRGEAGLQADGNSFDMMKGLLKVKK